MKLPSTYMKLKSFLSARLSLLAAATCLVGLSATAQTTDAPVPLVKDITALTHLGGCAPSNLLNSDINLQYHSANEDEDNDIGDQYLEVTFKDLTDPNNQDKVGTLNLNSNEDMVVYIQRCPKCDDRQPTVFRVMGLPVGKTDEEKNWEPFCHVYFLFRGMSTKEYSARIHPTKEYQKLRFYVVANNTRSYGKNGRHSMGLAEFQIFKVERDANYPEPMKDQFHLRDDYNRAYEDYTFVPTMGWLDERNRSYDNTTDNLPSGEKNDNLNKEAHEKGDLTTQQKNITKLRNWANWESDWSTSGEWNLDSEALLELGVQMPSLAPIKNDPDFDPSANMQVQPTHVTEHILYALPGDPIILIPYGNFAEPKHFEKYEVNFAHWYDYRTGDKIIYKDENTEAETNLLDFLADPWGVCTSEKNGFFGAYLLAEKKVGNDIQLPGRQSKNYGMFATFFCPRDPFTEEGVAHSLPFRDIDKKKDPNDPNDTNEFVIAADFSQSFNKGRNINTTGKELIEPNIAFRHIFRIRDAKEFAEDFSGSAKNNEAYVLRNRRDITARANKPFQIGLDVSVPEPWDRDGRWRSIPSEYYYKISDSDYRRINAMRLRVTEPDGTVTNIEGNALWNSESLFYFGEPYDGLGERDYDGANYKIAGGGIYDHIGRYYRMLESDEEDLRGKYKVEIIGQEIINQKKPSDIMVYGSSQPLVVMEFDIDFVDNEDATTPKAILVSSEKLHTNNNFKAFREVEMVKKYGLPKDSINFDYYRGLEDLPTANEYLDARITGSKHYQFRWPAAWNKSQYANGYSNDHNYNMYVVANHTSRTPYHNFWHHNDLHRDEETSGLYDRLHDKTTRLKATDENVAVQNGYFLYVNAATDPGVMVTLNVDNLCTGSTVHVSAWVAEFSKEEEMANIVFNFVAVLANGDRVNLHSFVSGYIPRNIGDYNNPSVNTNDGGPGQWMNISYSFNPDVTRFNAGQIDHYELEMENNCKSSSGADYAIDDIKVYIVSPVVGAEQESPICTDTEGDAENIVRIETPFTETLQAIDVAEAKNAAAGKALIMQYVILDREKFDKAYGEAEEKGYEDPGKTAYETEGVVIGSGSVNFNSFAANIQDYSLIGNTESDMNVAGMRTDTEREVRMLAFKTKFNDPNFKIGKEYYISLYVAEQTEPAEGTEATEQTEETETTNALPDWTVFNIKDPCAKYCVFTVKGKNNLRVDGEIREQNGEISVCEGESPTISIDIATLEGTKEYLSAYCDWFLGTREEYDAVEEGEMSLYNAMSYFRNEYPEAESPEAEGIVAKGDFTEEMRQYIISNSDKLIFYKKSYQFPAIKIPEGEDMADDVVLVLPIPQVENEESVTVCTAPMEVHIYADIHSPKVLHGLRDGITYPEGMENVPLRIGLNQLNKVTVKDDAPIATNNALLIIPIRTVETSGVVSEVKAMSRKSDIILLESTTDPNYDMEPKTETAESGETYVVLPEYEAGKICSFIAKIGGGENSLGAVFNKSFTFREGYEYTFSYRFKEAVGVIDPDVKLCDGRTYFTIKVVPEYLVWTGSTSDSEDEGDSEVGTGSKVNRNWNNDGNWKRVSSSDLKVNLSDDDLYAATSDADAKVKVLARLKDKVTDEEGTNTNESAFVPIDFTKVIIPATSTALPPYLYDCPEVTTDCPEVTTNGNVLDVATNATDDSGEATKWIEYDMVAREADSEDTSEDINNIYCGLWYANTCKEIHFLANSSIMNQQWLKYGKAWVDLELNPSRWYTLAMPLKKVFAGEFYLPTAGARQVSELFQEITYDPEKNNRFNPAVFQRGWDKGKALTYLPEPTGKTSSAVVKANWSHVYNDVEESYGSGTGFSIKADVSNVKDASGNVAAPEKVLFRLPKADTQYAYYDHNGDELNTANRKKINHGEEHYKLNATSGTITATTAGKKYFLVGNPFMTHLDMAKFLQANATKIEQKYWIVTSGSQKVAVFDPESDGLVGNATGAVAPMQGFFVEALSANGVDALDATDGGNNATESNATSTLELTYNEDMMCDASFDDTAANGSPLKAPTRSSDEGFTLRISALNDGEESTAAILGTSSYASNAYRAEEDMVVLDNSDLEVRATVYTVGDGKALSVNRLEGIGKVELGVIALPDEETVLRFNTEDAAAGLKLYDAQTGIYTSIYDGLTYPITGNASGRLYLTASSDVAPVEASQITWSASGEEVIVRSNVEAADGLTVKVYDYAGRCVVSQSVADSEVRFRIASGVYVLEAEAGAERLCVQIKI